MMNTSYENKWYSLQDLTRFFCAVWPNPQTELNTWHSTHR